MSQAIFADLEIEYRDVIMDDPVEFSRRVWEVADNLKAICRADTSVSSLEKMYREQSKEIKPEQEVQEIFNEIYELAEKDDLNRVPVYIEMAKRLVKDLETAFRDRCVYESARESSAISDKRVAHAQYTRLRDAFNLYQKTADLFFPEVKGQIKALPPLPGNYGSGANPLKSHVYTIGEDEYRNHHVVCRQLGIPVMNVSDLHDYIAEHELDCKITEIVY
jgi:hypothetical protein